jgi:chromate transporter
MVPVPRKGESLSFRARFRYGSSRLKRISRTTTLGGIFLSFLKIGLTGFGGGLAVIGQMRTMVVRERRWFTDHEFAEAFALAQSLPGTSSGNVATYIGQRLRGWRGAVVAISAFILPSMVMMIGLAILYRHFRSVPHTDKLFHGLNAAVVAFILVTAWRIGRNSLSKKWQWWVGSASCLAAVIFNATTIEIVLAAGLIGIYVDSFGERRWQRWRRIRRLAARRRQRILELERQSFVGGHLTRAVAEERVRRQQQQREDKIEQSAGDADGRSGNGVVNEQLENELGSRKTRSFAPFLAVGMPVLAKMGLLIALSSIFLRVGAVTFGGGFVMIPLIEADVVEAKQWLTHQEFADATALGQLTPGPVLITATFIGYRVAGTLGALVATVAIFLPAFLMTLAAGSSLRRFRANRQVQAFLRGVTPAVVGLLVAAALGVGRAGIHSWIGVLIMLACMFILLRFKPNPFWVIAGAGIARVLFGIALA